MADFFMSKQLFLLKKCGAFYNTDQGFSDFEDNYKMIKT